MFQQIIPRSLLWLVSLCAVLIIGITGCGGDDDDSDWVGTWSIDTVDGQSYEQAFEEEGVKASIVTNDWTFNSDGTMEAELAAKFEVTEEGLELSGKVSMKAVGTYSLSGSNYTLTITTEGEGTGFWGEMDGPTTDEDTGTWSRKGNTLTLNSDDDTTIVFKKK